MIKWYLSRLRTMSVRELLFRLKQILNAQYEKYFNAGKDLSKVNFTINNIPFNFTEENHVVFEYTVNIFGKNYDFSTGEIDWHTDIFSMRSFPRTFSKSINMRHDPELSAKVVWELNRLLFLNFIALNFRFTGNRKHLELFMAIVDSWIKNNPYLLGVNWYSNIEVNIRLIVWYFAWMILDAGKLMDTDKEFKEFVEQRWIPIIYQHCKYSHSNPSRFSSSNNHLVAEYAGLFIATSLWNFRESGKWNTYAKAGLEEEILHQYSVNGVNKEEAAEYIQFITDFFLISYTVAENSKNPFSEAFSSRLHQIGYYIHSMLDIKGNFPQYGDEDDGAVLLFEQEEHPDNFRSILSSLAVIFNDSVLKAGSKGADRKNAILFGNEFRRFFDGIRETEQEKESAFYPAEGHFFLRKQENDKEIYIHFDAAPLGFLSIAAHGHADALSFMMHVNGKPVNIDSGTYTYHNEPEWRKYFIGTLAHNTIRINRRDQATNAGPTMWLNHYTCKVLSHESKAEFDRVKASHNGYRDVGIEHIRELYFDKRKNSLVINDRIISQHENPYFLEFPLHFHPECSIELLENNRVEVKIWDGIFVDYELDRQLKVNLVSGQESPEILGWYSPSFMKKIPANTIYAINEFKGNLDLTCRLSFRYPLTKEKE